MMFRGSCCVFSNLFVAFNFFWNCHVSLVVYFNCSGRLSPYKKCPPPSSTRVVVEVQSTVKQNVITYGTNKTKNNMQVGSDTLKDTKRFGHIKRTSSTSFSHSCHSFEYSMAIVDWFVYYLTNQLNPPTQPTSKTSNGVFVVNYHPVHGHYWEPGILFSFLPPFC